MNHSLAPKVVARGPTGDDGLEEHLRTGRLVPLRTKAEFEAQCQLTDAFITRVPAKSTAAILE